MNSRFQISIPGAIAGLILVLGHTSLSRAADADAVERPLEVAGTLRIRETYPLRFTLSAHQFALDPSSGFDGDLPVGGTLSVTVFPGKRLGIGSFLGNLYDHHAYFYGAEVEFHPLQLSAFGVGDFFEAGVLFGGSNLGREYFPEIWGTFHAGMRVVLNLGDRFGLTGSVRANVSQRQLYAYLLSDAGVALRF